MIPNRVSKWMLVRNGPLKVHFLTSIQIILNIGSLRNRPKVFSVIFVNLLVSSHENPYPTFFEPEKQVFRG